MYRTKMLKHTIWLLIVFIMSVGFISVSYGKGIESYILYYENYKRDRLLMVNEYGTDKRLYPLNGYGVFAPSGNQYAYVIPIESQTDKSVFGEGMKKIGGIIRIAKTDGFSDLEIFRSELDRMIPTQLQWAPNEKGLYFRYVIGDTESPPGGLNYLDLNTRKTIDYTTNIDIKCDDRYSVNSKNGKIAYIKQEMEPITGNQYLMKEMIITCNADGSDAIVVAGPQVKHVTLRGSGGGAFASPMFYSAPLWSPDGNSIAYWARENGRNVLFVSTGPGYQTKTQLAEGGYNIAWSPDGRKVAYNRDVSGNTRYYMGAQITEVYPVIFVVSTSGQSDPVIIGKGILENWVAL